MHILGIKVFLKRLVLQRGIVKVLGHLRLYLEFLLADSNNESLCLGHDLIESKSLSHRATRLACSVTKPNLAWQSEYDM